MKNLRKFISLCLPLCILISLVPVGTLAEETEQAPISGELTWVSEEDTDSEELYEGYALQQFCGGTSYFGTAAGERLSGDEKAMYDALVPIIRQIADGNRASATITIGQGSSVDSKAVFTGSDLSEGALGRVLDALLSDLPYECYWYDKTTGCKLSYSGWDTITSMTFRFTVGIKYRGADQYTADTTKTGSAKLAAANAKSIVSKYAGASDYEKLIGYRDEICALVSYDHSAASTGNYFKTDLNPWQLISVFDGDNTTNVVCEGYSKAFMYLCDMTDFSGDVTCHTVSGTMNGGGHMWNIVDIAGKHYLADITNSDVGTSGNDGSLFLAGGTGTAAGGYTVSGIRYAYKTDMIELWGTGEDSLLTLEAENYVPDAEDEEKVIGGKCGENLTWTLENGTLTISGSGTMDEYAFDAPPWDSIKECIISVNIDEGVTAISTSAFENCTELTNISIAGSVVEYGSAVFNECTKLTNVSLSTSASILSDSMFRECKNLASITIPNGITAIGNSTFSGCAALTEIVLPPSIEELFPYAFWKCTALRKVTFEGDAPSIWEGDPYQYGSFDGCELTAYYPADNPTWTAAVMQNYGGNITWKPDCGGNHSLVILPAVEATCQATGLTDGVSCEVCGFVSRAQEVVPVSDHKYNAQNICRFCGCVGGNCGLEITNLKWNLADGVLTISGTGDMRNVDSSIYSPWNSHSDKITSVVVEEGVETIGSNMLGLLPNLKQVSLPETLRHIGTGAFHTNPQLEYIDFPKSLESIGSSAFQNSGLKEVALPENVWIGAYAFENCTALKKVKIDSALDTDSNGSYLFQGCTALTDVTLGEHVKRIGQYMFAGCTSLKQITIPGNVKMLAANAFDGCTALTDVTLVKGVEHIGPKAFARCTALREFTFPASISEMEEGVFNRCENLDQIWFAGDAPVIDGSAFSTLKVKAYYPADNGTWTKDVCRYYGGTLIEWVPYNHTHSYTPVVTAPNCTEQGYTTHTCSCGNTYRDSYVAPTGVHTYSDDRDMNCNVCGFDRRKPAVLSVPMYRMYDPNSGEHFYTGSTVERDFLVTAGWHYEGVGFNFPEEGKPVYRLYEPTYGEHLYTMDEAEKAKLISWGWNDEGVAFNSAGADEVPQYRLHNPNAKRGGYHFTGSDVERDILIEAGWIYEGIGWYSCEE